MAYTDFTLEDIESKFGIKNIVQNIFDKIEKLEPSQKLKEHLQKIQDLPIRSEKAKSEAIVFPILLELREKNQNYFTIYSGDMLNADEEKGLKGECDFILSKDVKSYSINYPILQVVEAKKNDVESGVAQCVAQVLGAKIFNEKKKINLPEIYGCITTGSEWLFMKLVDDTIYIDKQKYFLVEIEYLLAVFQKIMDYYKNILK